MKYRKLNELRLLKNNPRYITKEKLEKLKASIQKNKEYFEARPLILSNRTGDLVIIAGNQRYRAARDLGLKEVPTFLLEGLTEEKEKEIIIRDNIELGDWDFDLLANNFDIEDLEEWGVEIEDIKKEEKEYQKEEAKKKLAEKFILPPFSILDTTQKYWQDRKKTWTILIGNDGVTREDVQLYGYENMTTEVGMKIRKINKNADTSILDPCLCETMLKWFLPYNEAKIFDPFSGGSMGFIASYLGHQFIGTELRPEQAKINNDRIKEYSQSIYYCDDGQNIDKYCEPESQDFLFSCPPYFNLEKYSNLENDASNQDYEGFLKILKNALFKSINALKQNRFACIVMSDVRDKKGNYLTICDEIRKTFIENGCYLYNEIILINSISTGGLLATKYMKNRKVVRRHQEVLIFFKGNAKSIQKEFKNIDDLKMLDNIENII